LSPRVDCPIYHVVNGSLMLSRRTPAPVILERGISRFAPATPAGIVHHAGSSYVKLA